MNTYRPHHPFANCWIVVAFLGLFAVQFGVSPAVAQDGSSDAKRAQKKKVQKLFNKGKSAAQSGNYEEASDIFEEALTMAEEIQWDQAVQMSQQFLVKSLKEAGTTANKEENYETALDYYEKVLQYVDNDPAVHYNRGIALLGANRTEEGLQSLQRAIEIGNKTGNTRVAGRATERIRAEFISRASEALQGENSSQAQINAALEALDQMREYADPSANSLFYRALALHRDGQHAQAIETARRGLNMHQGSRSDAAKYHYYIAESQMALGDKATACRTFNNAAYGDYEARANHALENDCDDL